MSRARTWRKEGTTTRASADDEEARRDSDKDRDQTPRSR